ncbi:hypothetical protein QI193_11050 [Staphylococcus saprophyticus]|uniref:hypothetical protein n=1 Tax=Staphylococcus saprophyticus TaxID=29385 RepID=UPI0011A239D0|nr:hypothetical protein [Staphylococcus saprophyticus]MDW3803086.1 hypothetical protein [Staphylococcus saprophyticus]MDW3893601.1 hypothetical protein [Staphylococcus saprophyticus]MDW3958301.1 hypothetical protein [Staphylococcus saprophyticus]MDW4176933.1 hypothetical protein [Staphylococcus saprophyticus]MVA84877.1 hypothetical protein [Staphylococcus saprophyticus]
MLKEYVKWFCEFIDVPYETKETMNLWILRKNQQSEYEIGVIHYVENNSKQITMFDYDIAI